ncbi:hypothetical protein QTP88_022642 [Uroleucon formosanum]
MVGKKFTDAEKLQHLENLWTPGKNSVFPSTQHGKKQLKFQFGWLENWKWLAYSKIEDGAYCKYCVLFSKYRGGKGSQLLSIIADETADISGVEQFALCARYYDVNEKKMCESFLKFVPVDDVSGQSLANHIITELKDLNIEIKNLRGQGYDGAASMSGKLNGVAALIRKEYPSALYIHCSAHNLNLSVSYACNIQGIRNTMGTVEACYNFLNTPKRQNFFNIHLAELKKKETSSNKQKLKRLCPTRWVERYNSIETFNEFFPAIIYCLEEMITWKDIDTSSKANQLLLALQSSEFNVALSVLNHIFQYTQSLCKYLQSKNIDLVVAVNHINLVKNQLSCIRENATTEFNKLFIDINKRLNDFELTIEMPRLAKRQKNRDNIPTKDPEEYFRITLFLPFLDSFVQQLNDRFVNHQNIISGFQMFVKSSEFDEEKLRELVEFYANDVDDFDRVKSETILWNRYLTDILGSHAWEVIVGDTRLYPKANFGSDKAHLAWQAFRMILRKIGTRSVKGILYERITI